MDPGVELAYVDYDWALDVKNCPCDVQFVEWLDESGTTWPVPNQLTSIAPTTEEAVAVATNASASS